MTVRALLDFVKHTHAFNAQTFTDDVLIRYLNELEGKIQTDIMHIFHDGITQYENTEEDLAKELYVVAPYDELYYLWLYYKIDLTNGETAKAANYKAAFEAAWETFVAYYTRTYYNVWG